MTIIQGNSRSSKLAPFETFILIFHCNCRSSIASPRYNDLSIEHMRFFRRFYPPQSRLKPSQRGCPRDLGYQSLPKGNWTLWATRQWKPRDDPTVITTTIGSSRGFHRWVAHSFFCRTMLCISAAMPSRGVCLSVCLSVTFVYYVEMSKYVLALFHHLVLPPF